MPETHQIRIRTYRHGLGDCFLLTVVDASESAGGLLGDVHVLIDCGVLLGTDDARRKMNDVVADIVQTTNGRIDVVVATHEHWDHISGFNQAREQWESSGLNIGAIWMAWTEDLDDPLANRLRQDREERRRALAPAYGFWDRQLAAIPNTPGSFETERLQQTRGLLEFFGEDHSIGLNEGEAVGRRTTADAMEYLRQRPEPHRYLRPGQLLALPGADPIRVYVLGPPRNEKWLKKERPSTRTPETYHLSGGAMSLADSFFSAVGHHDPAGTAHLEQRPSELLYPFDEAHQRAEPPVATDDVTEWFINHYRLAATWRNIDTDWLRSTTDFALKLDSDTNNTSLVLAFEIGDGGPVLLFPGDAQVGNWLSWQHVTWPEAGQTTAEDLLKRTVFYKVAHHGSHNATLEELGLELMDGPALTAMVPVDRATADKQRWAMPFEPLWTRLNERADGRVLRSDETPARDHPIRCGYTRAGTTVSIGHEPAVRSDFYIDISIDVTC